MTGNDLLLGLLDQLRTQAALYLTQDTIQDWPDGLLGALVDAGLLQPASPANSIECRGCACGCIKPVERMTGPPTRAFILCDEEPALGRIPVELKRLQQWQASSDRFAQWLADQVDGIPKVEVIQALPSLPLNTMVELKGATLTLNQPTLRRLMSKGPETALSPTIAPENHISLNADVWTVTFHGQTRYLQNTKGMRLIALLIRNQGQRCHVIQMEHELNPAPPKAEELDQWSSMSTDQFNEMGLSVNLGGSWHEGIDAKTRGDCESKIKSLQERIEDAAERGDIESQEKFEAEQEKILKYLGANLGLAGKPRQINSETEKSRKRVLAVISKERKSLKTSFPEFASHLACLETGTECIYQPDPPQSWTF